MQTLWGDDEAPQPTKNKTSSRPRSAIVSLTANDCVFFGHTWQLTGVSGEKQCSICHMKGFCPLCTPIAPKGADPYFCTRHTPRAERRCQA